MITQQIGLLIQPQNHNLYAFQPKPVAFSLKKSHLLTKRFSGSETRKFRDLSLKGFKVMLQLHKPLVFLLCLNCFLSLNRC